eukprot:TRINITY_DN10656_c0_g3_i2.p1 TRINITY_DN10656_c0_g3~~TRINITY_DN10656_c0_g3_i2.p1  ORF type:complete len:469 (+),score=46.89 TRINITY_DN10656_c0_g3_i2:50-1408(+)
MRVERQEDNNQFVCRFLLPLVCPKNQSYVAPILPTLPVLLIPGEFGTVLNIREKGTKADGERVWVKIERADSQMKKLWGKFNDITGRVEQLDSESEVFVAESEEDGLFALETLDPSWPNNVQIIQCFSKMIQQFKEKGYIAGQTLFGFGYDFRQSCSQHSMELLDKLRSISEMNGGRRINVVTHSMGGLLLKSLLAEHPQEFEKYINKWISIAAPFGGSPGYAMDSLICGRQFVRGWESHFFVQQQTYSQLCAQCPSMYEICRYNIEKNQQQHDEKYNTNPQIILWMKSDIGVKQECYSIQHFQQLQQKVMTGNQVVLDGNTHEMALNQECWNTAAQSTRIWDNLELPSTCQFYNLYGVGFNTPYSIIYGSPQDPLYSHTDIKQTNNSTFIGVDGDGVVPVNCATQDGLDAVERIGVQGLHKNLLASKQVFLQVQKWILQDNLFESEWIMVL